MFFFDFLQILENPNGKTFFVDFLIEAKKITQKSKIIFKNMDKKNIFC